MKKTLLILIFSSLYTTFFAQKQTLSGYVSDMATGEKLIGATVYLPQTKTGTATNSFGFYSLSFTPSDSLSITVSYIGYQKYKTSIKAKANTRLNMQLQQLNNTLTEVTVTAQNQIQDRVEISTIDIPISQIKTLPALGGEVDILKAIQLMPGVQSGGEGQSGLYVRGGSADQNLILLDGVPLYHVNHLGGFVSVFNADAINTTKLIKGGFPASYGNRLSSVLDIRMKDGNLKEFEYQGSVGLISSKFSVEGPLVKDKTSFIFSGRRFMLDIFTKPITYIIADIFAGYTFYDTNLKLSHKFSDKDRLFFSFYTGDDRTTFRMGERERNEKEVYKSLVGWGNTLAALRWNHVYGNKLFGNLTLAHTRYKYLTNFQYKSEEQEAGSVFVTEVENKFESGIKDLSLNMDFEYYLSENYELKFGASSVYHVFTPGTSSYKFIETGQQTIDTAFNNKTYNVIENAVYIENRIKLGTRVKTNIGLRASAYTHGNKTFYSAEPRMVTNILVTEKLSLKASYSLMQQTIHLLSHDGFGMSTDLWVPATQNVPPEKAHQFAVGFAQTLHKNQLELSVEAYYKTMNGLACYKEGAAFLGTARNWEESVFTNGTGKSYGLELLLQKKEGKSTGWVGYTLSRTTRHFVEQNNGKPYVARHDRTHDISVVFNHKFSERINLAATWVYGTGNAFTLPNEYYKTPEIEYLETFPYHYYANTTYVKSYEQKNSYRMRAFHKLDVGVNLTKQKKWGERTWYFGVYNLYNRQNPYFYFYKTIPIEDEQGNPTDKRERKLFQQSLFPIIPSISYSFKF